MQWKITEKHNGITIKDYLQNVKQFSRRMLKVVKFKGGNILINGSPQNVTYVLRTGDILSIQMPEEAVGAYMNAQHIPLSILYEDDALLIIDKRAGIATIPSRNHPDHTIANGLLAYYRDKNLPYTVHVVTRLDKDTSGLLLIAKHRYSHSLLDKTLKNKKITRKYKAIVQGRLKMESGIIDAPIGRKEGSIIERQVNKSGQRAVTHYKMIRASTNYSLVEIKLETGRTHQIRVHFSHLGHPLVGDDLYGGSLCQMTRQALHCAEIRVEHPLTKEILTFQSPLPNDMSSFLRRIQLADY
ncbi:RluA family pseudouridine synthase [Virgibacillus sp. W0430]|uniref:RluA family pseudouridine synthase n=1 Tax=Virgibacillus sp. W0430 TaxID=3391580 RepID=UPI003F45E13E